MAFNQTLKADYFSLFSTKKYIQYSMTNKNLDFSTHGLRKGWEQYEAIKTSRNLLNKMTIWDI